MDATITQSALYLYVALGGLGVLGGTLAMVYILWLCYLGIMQLRDRRDEGALTILDKVFGYPTLAIGLVADFLANLVPMSIILLELPREMTVSARCLRHARSVGVGRLARYRFTVCFWILTQIQKHDRSGGHNA